MTPPSPSKRVSAFLVLAPALLVLVACAGPPPSAAPSPAFSPRFKGTVVLDPGHPSEGAVGASGPAGATEIQVNWAMAKKLQPLMEEAGYQVILTKLAEEELVTNRQRAEIGTLHHTDIIVRLHCDAGNHKGTATFYPDRTGTKWGITGPSQEVVDGSRALAAGIEAYYARR